MTTTPPPSAWIDPWPDGRIHREAPVAAVWLAELASELRRRSAELDQVATAAGLDIRTIRAVLDGSRWPTLHTVAALVEHLPPNDPAARDR